MKKSYLYNILLFIFSLTIALGVSEYLFRFMLFNNTEKFRNLKDPSYYVDLPGDKNEYFYTEDYWKLNYLFNKKFNNQHPHPLLGWRGKFDYNLVHTEANKTKDKRTVLLYGDSFAMCIDSVKCFEEYLNQDTGFSVNHYLLNYGVGGYGVDQSYLLFHETADKFKSPFIIFSLLTVDMDRCVLNVRDAQKPYFTVENNELILNGTPITMGSEEFFKENPPQIKSYLWNKFYRSPLNVFGRNINININVDYIEKIKGLNKLILEKLFRELKDLNTDFLVLIFQPEHHTIDDWRLLFLQDICEKNQIPFIVDTDVKKTDDEFYYNNKNKYNIQHDGHPTSYLTTLISEELKKYILNPGTLNDLIEINRKWKYKYVDHYRNLILTTPEWLESTKAKALLRGIPTDSMVTLDAIYMVENHLMDE